MQAAEVQGIREAALGQGDTPAERCSSRGPEDGPTLEVDHEAAGEGRPPLEDSQETLEAWQGTPQLSNTSRRAIPLYILYLFSTPHKHILGCVTDI